jgi:hypothetical protein
MSPSGTLQRRANHQLPITRATMDELHPSESRRTVAVSRLWLFLAARKVTLRQSLQVATLNFMGVDHSLDFPPETLCNSRKQWNSSYAWFCRKSVSPWRPTASCHRYSLSSNHILSLSRFHVAGNHNFPPSDTRHFSFVTESLLGWRFLWHAPLR